MSFKLSDLKKFINSLPEKIHRADPVVTIFVSAGGTEYAIKEADFDDHAKPPKWLTIITEKHEYVPPKDKD